MSIGKIYFVATLILLFVALVCMAPPVTVFAFTLAFVFSCVLLALYPDL